MKATKDELTVNERCRLQFMLLKADAGMINGGV